MSALQIILVGALGSALQELLHWYGLREHLKKDRYKQLITSVPYWVVTGLMIIGSGVAVWLWFSEDEVSARQYLVLGAALPLIFKKAVDAVVAPSKPDATVASRGSLRTYFAGGAREERLA
jgi:hypothetical protein